MQRINNKKVSMAMSANETLDIRQLTLLKYLFLKKEIATLFTWGFSSLAVEIILIILNSLFVTKGAILVVIYLLLGMTSFISTLAIALGIIETITLFHMKKGITKVYGTLPTELIEIIKNRIDELCAGVGLPPEYYQTEKDYLS
ncbi:hypothetical protein IKW73_00880 [Candidatus Saccharibacteria bacterium]|nr:hypothetical protein [Candidatus Saccharibacteria bacterium]